MGDRQIRGEPGLHRDFVSGNQKREEGDENVNKNELMLSDKPALAASRDCVQAKTLEETQVACALWTFLQTDRLSACHSNSKYRGAVLTRFAVEFPTCHLFFTIAQILPN